MKTNSDWAPGPDLRILGAERQGAGWVVTAEAPGPGCCPGCDRPSRCRHGWRVRHLQDLPVQGADATLNLKGLCFPLCGAQGMLHVRLRGGIRKDGKISVVGARAEAESHVCRAR